MGERTQYTPGTFCWADLTTTDQGAAKTFYSGLFGWEIEDMPVDESTSYSMARIDGKNVAAISPQPPFQRDASVPPVWNSYVSVESADATAARAEELGGSAHAPPFDVMGAGRMAVLQDPQGAFFMAWEPKDHFGAQLVNAPGALVWNELATPDIGASGEFYGGLFGWTTDPMEGMGGEYLVIKVGEASNGGIRPLSPPLLDAPTWIVYFGTEDVEAGAAKVEELGGTKVFGPVDIGIAKFTVVQDPQGAMFVLYAGELQP